MRPILTLALLLSAGLFFADHRPASAAKDAVVAPAVKDGKVADPARKALGEEHADGHAKKDPMSFTGIKRYDLGIYTLVVFALLYFILKTFAWGPISQGLDKREATIVAAKEAAEKSVVETRRLTEEAKAMLQKAADDARGIVEEARRDAVALKDRLSSEGREELAAERDRLKREIESARDQALQEIWNQTVSLSTMISSKVVRREMTKDDHARLLADSMTELKKGLGQA